MCALLFVVEVEFVFPLIRWINAFLLAYRILNPIDGDSSSIKVFSAIPRAYGVLRAPSLNDPGHLCSMQDRNESPHLFHPYDSNRVGGLLPPSHTTVRAIYGIQRFPYRVRGLDSVR